MSFIETLLTQDFLQRALFTGILIGILAPLLGSLVVVRRLSFIADTLSHFSLAGISAGLFLISSFGYVFIGSPMYLGIGFAVVGGLFIELLRAYYKNYKEISMPIVMSVGTAVSLLFISLSGGMNSSIYSYLFGSILTVTSSSVIMIVITLAVTLILYYVFKKPIITLCFDESYARLQGINVGLFQVIFTVLLSIVISLSIEVVGVLLVSSLMIIPVAAAMKVGWSYKSTVVIAMVFSEISIVFGFWISFALNIPSGATIVLLCVLFFIISFIYKKLHDRSVNKAKKIK